jgi:hypothetical protein
VTFELITVCATLFCQNLIFLDGQQFSLALKKHVKNTGIYRYSDGGISVFAISTHSMVVMMMVVMMMVVMMINGNDGGGGGDDDNDDDDGSDDDDSDDDNDDNDDSDDGSDDDDNDDSDDDDSGGNHDDGDDGDCNDNDGHYLLIPVNSEANTRRITNVEKCFGASGQPLAITSRVLVGEGVLTKLCRKKPKPRQVRLK